jgi:hypothetical protein
VNQGIQCRDCGTTVPADANFCGSCGAAVATGDSHWSGGETADDAVQTVSEATPDTRTRWHHSREARFIFGGVVAALLLTVVLALGSNDDSADADTKTADAEVVTETVDEGPPPEERCVDLWNGADAETARGMGSVYRSMGDAYVSVGFADDFPDKCMITVAYPSQDRVSQFIESGSTGGPLGPFGAPSTGNISDLPESTKDWNASMAENGTVTLD